jgi:hypothetical protein
MHQSARPTEMLTGRLPGISSTGAKQAAIDRKARQRVGRTDRVGKVGD